MRKRTGEIGLIAKAWNGRCILSWLSSCLQEALVTHGNNDELVMACSATTLAQYTDWVDLGFACFLLWVTNLYDSFATRLKPMYFSGGIT